MASTTVVTDHRAGSDRGPWLPALLDAWAVVLTLVLSWPMWSARGYGLARDLIFTPDRPWTLATFGMGGAVPRAVPLDSFLSAGTTVLGGEVLFRLCVAGVLVAAGCGAHRVLPQVSGPARVGVVAFAIWNPFTVERVAMGQWALLVGYAALFWLLPAWRRWLTPGSGGGGARIIGWTVLGSLTPTGGAVVLLVATATALTSRGGWRRGGLVLGTALAQLPWILPALLGGHPLTSDPRGVDAFAARGGSAGLVVALASGGGIWNPFATPNSAEGPYALVGAALAIAALAFGFPLLWSRHRGLVIAAGVGIVCASFAAIPGGRHLLITVIDHIPGGGLLRDGQKWLLPYVVLVALAYGVLAEHLMRWARRVDLASVAAVSLALTPVVSVPDATAVVWDVLRPVTYPADVAQVVRLLDDAPDDSGGVVTLPFAAYRSYPWGLDLSAADPISRWSSRPAIVADGLAASGGRLRESVQLSGEDPLADEVGRALAGDPRELAAGLARSGVGWVVVFRDAEPAASPDLVGLDPVAEGAHTSLWRVPLAPEPLTRPAPVRVALVVTAHVLWGLALLVASALGVMAGQRRRHLQ